jgi:uncharacterized protein
VIVDVDAHYLEDHRVLASYLPEPLRTRISRTAPGRLLPASTGDRGVAGRIVRPDIHYPQEPTPPEEIPKIMEFLGVDISVQLPNRMLALSATSQKDVAVGLAEGHAQYMVDRVMDPKAGIYGMIIAPVADPRRAAGIIRRHGEQAGFAAVCLITAGAEPPLGDTFYDPIYQAAQDVGLPIVYHSSGSGIDDFLIRGFQRFLETHSLGFVFFNMATIVSMLVQGVPERFPQLKFGFQEAGIFYIPMLMYRLDAEFRKRRAEAPLLRRLPSEYMRDFFYGTQPIEEPPRIEYLQHVFEMIDGASTLTFSTDYPHWDFDMPSVIRDLPFLSEAEKSQVLGGNAMRLFRFEGR